MLSDYELFLSFHSWFQQWLMLWFRIQKKHGADRVRLLGVDNRLLSVLRYLNTAPLKDGLPIKVLGTESVLSDAHLNRMFIAKHAVTIRKYWEQRRLNEARRFFGNQPDCPSKRPPTIWASRRTRTS